MIARVDGETVHLITQPDHARLARRIMERAAPLASRWVRVGVGVVIAFEIPK